MYIQIRFFFKIDKDLAFLKKRNCIKSNIEENKNGEIFEGLFQFGPYCFYAQMKLRNMITLIAKL